MRILFFVLLFVQCVPAAIVDATRVIDWTYAGIPGGIPAGQTVWASDCTMSIPGTGSVLVGDGSTNNDSVFAYIIANCPTGQVAKLGSGNFLCSSDIAIGTKGIILRGNGPSLTIITGTSITAGTGSGTSNTTTLASGAAKDATSVAVVSATGLTTGEQLAIEGGDDTFVNRTGYEDATASGQAYIGTITNVSGTTISLNPPLPWAIAGGAAVKSYTGAASGVWTTGVGLEDFKTAPNNITAINWATGHHQPSPPLL